MVGLFLHCHRSFHFAFSTVWQNQEHCTQPPVKTSILLTLYNARAFQMITPAWFLSRSWILLSICITSVHFNQFLAIKYWNLSEAVLNILHLRWYLFFGRGGGGGLVGFLSKRSFKYGYIFMFQNCGVTIVVEKHQNIRLINTARRVSESTQVIINFC